MDGTPPAGNPLPVSPGQEPKNPSLAGFCSSVLPGLGQIYNGQIVKGYCFFFLTLAGLVLILPGLLVWLYAMYDAYDVAGKMNTGAIEPRPARILHVALFLLVAIAVVAVAVVAVAAFLIAVLTNLLGQADTGIFPGYAGMNPYR
jgi:TM2 domain-containing membrane protein YozV